MREYNEIPVPELSRVFNRLEACDIALREMILTNRGKWKEIAAHARLPYQGVRRYALGQTSYLPPWDMAALFKATVKVMEAQPKAPPPARAKAIRRAAVRLPHLVGGVLLE